MNTFAGTLLLAALCGAPDLHAADATGQPEEPAPSGDASPSWALQITPYMWAAGIKGAISPFRSAPTIEIEKSFSEVMDDLNSGGFVNVWARYDRFVFSGDVMYVDTSDSHGTGPLPGIAVPGLGAIPPGINVDADVDTKQFTATLMGGYRVIDTADFTLDALGGARFWHIANDVTLTASLGGVSASVNHDESFGWIDPLVGVRAFLPITEKLSFQAQADVGGFDAGADLTWSALATVNYIVTDRLPSR